MQKPRVYSLLSLADEWGCSRSTVLNAINSGRLQSWRAGGKLLRIDPKAVDAYIETFGHPHDVDPDRKALADSIRACRPFDHNIYFAATGEFIKIGYARKSNLLLRMLNIQCMNPRPLVLLAVAEGKIADEQALHRRFRHLRERGEWFRREGDLVEFIESTPCKGVPTGTNEPVTLEDA